MRPIARVLIDESHRQAWSIRPELAARMRPTNPADASYARAAQAARELGLEIDVHADGHLDAEALAGVDALVIPHCADDAWEHTTGTGDPRFQPAELDAIESFVNAGGGLLVLGETEQAKYGNNVAELTARFGIQIVNTTVQDPTHAFNGVATWVLAELEHGKTIDLAARVEGAAFYRAGVLRADGAASDVLARTSRTADPAAAPLILTSSAHGGRVAVASDSDLFGDDSIRDLDNEMLWRNLVIWVAASPAANAAHDQRATDWPADHDDWHRLAAACEAIKAVQTHTGSINLAEVQARNVEPHIDVLIDSVRSLAPRFPHQRDYFDALERDLRAWVEAGFPVPDFLDSLNAFHPEQLRVDGVEHLAVFAMSTQNGNPDRSLEAVITRTYWPEWLAEAERTYDNAGFVPIEFVAFTSGYDTHSAVFFPETVAVRSTPVFTWGGIFCDREAARFRTVAKAAAGAVKLALPPDAAFLLDDQALAQDAFVLWDLVHDRIHSRGDLPFDPFMIKQRMPFWMYSLEELRCDVTTYRETLTLDVDGRHLGQYIRYAIVLDRLFRFSISGGRVRNYDGLAGQIIFAWLHRDDVLRWTNNVLTIDWTRLDDSMVKLCEAVEALYRTGIDRPKVGQWLATHAFIAELVPPHPASAWAQGPAALPLSGEPRGLVDAVLDDEFPLNVFFEALARNVGPIVESTAGITP